MSVPPTRGPEGPAATRPLGFGCLPWASPLPSSSAAGSFEEGLFSEAGVVASESSWQLACDPE